MILLITVELVQTKRPVILRKYDNHIQKKMATQPDDHLEMYF
jgi:hypothetical protein